MTTSRGSPKSPHLADELVLQAVIQDHNYGLIRQKRQSTRVATPSKDAVDAASPEAAAASVYAQVPGRREGAEGKEDKLSSLLKRGGNVSRKWGAGKAVMAAVKLDHVKDKRSDKEQAEQPPSPSMNDSSESSPSPTKAARPRRSSSLCAPHQLKQIKNNRV